MLSRGLTIGMAVWVAACAHTSSKMAALEGKTVYNQVTFHTEFRGGRHMSYSTNYYGVPSVIKVNTPLKAVSLSDKEMVFTLPDKSTWQLIFVAKHHTVDATSYFKKMFDKTPVVLPQNLSDKEKSAIEKGSFFIGMSRRAFFLALGYPPSTLTPSLDAKTLTYERKRFNHTRFDFDDKNRLVKVVE